MTKSKIRDSLICILQYLQFASLASMRSGLFLFCMAISFTKSFGQQASLSIKQLDKDLFVYTSYGTYNGTKYPANGVYLITQEGVVIFDSPWDTTQFQPLLDSIKSKHSKNVTMCFATHFHDDRTAGLEYFRNKGIRTFTTAKTDSLSILHHKPRAQFLLRHDSTFLIGQHSFQVYYPGEGHAPDNIVIWFPREKILYGGCLIKCPTDPTLGNLSDANLHLYPRTIRNVIQHCANPRFVIPGHNDCRDPGSLQYTLKLADKAKPEKGR